MSKTSILVTGLFYSGSSAVYDLLRQYDTVGVVPGEFDDFRRKGMIADHLSGKIAPDYPSNLQHMNFSIAGFASAMEAASNLKEKFDLANHFMNGLATKFAADKKFVLYDQPIFFNLHNDVWPSFFEPFKLIIVYRNFCDQVAELVRQHIYLDIENPTRSLVSLFGGSKEGAIKYESLSALHRYERAKELERIHGKDKVLLISFESLVKDYKNQKKVIERFVGLSPSECCDEFMFFKPEESEKNIGISKNILNDDEVKIVSAAIELSNKVGIVSSVESIFSGYPSEKNSIDLPAPLLEDKVDYYDLGCDFLPKVSVCIASYNHEDFVTAALESVFSQEYQNIEVIVVDDCSTDGSANVIEAVAAKYPLKLIKLDQNVGPSMATNRALQEASGDFVALLGSDDLMLPGRLSTQVEFLLENPNFVAVMTDIKAVDFHGEPHEHAAAIESQFNVDFYNLRKQLIAGNFINAPSALIRQDALIKVGGFSPLLRYTQDYELWTRLLEVGEVGKVNQRLTGYRVHGYNLSFGLQGDELLQTRVELVSVVVGYVSKLSEDNWALASVVQRYSLDNEQKLEVLLGLASVLQLVDFYYFKRPMLGTSCAYDLILKSSIIDAKRAALPKQKVESILGAGFGNIDELVYDEAVKWFGDILPRLGVSSSSSLSQLSQIKKWLGSRTLTSLHTEFVNEKFGKNGNSFAGSIVILNFESNEQAVQQTSTSIDSLKDLPGKFCFQAVQVTNRDGFTEKINQWITKSHDDWLLVVRAGDELVSSGLLMALIELGQNPLLDAISFDAVYSHQDDSQAAAFKPANNLDYLLSFPAASSRHWLFNRKALLDIGGFDTSLPDAFELDAILCLINQHGLDKLGHIPEPLVITQPPALANVDDERIAIERHLRERGYEHAQVHAPNPGRYQIRYNHPQQPVVSVVLAAGKHLDKLQRCVEGLLGSTSYQTFEILFIDQPDSSAEVKQWLAELAAMQEPKLRVHSTSKKTLAVQYNEAHEQAIGDYLLFLSADVAVISEHWLDEMLNHAQRGEVGIVGAKLLTSDGRIAHAGHILGLQGPVGSPFVGEPLDAPGYMQRLQVDQNLSSVGGDCMMVLKQLFTELGGFDASGLHDAYLSTDFCLRSREAGFLTVWTPHAQLMLDRDARPAPDSAAEDLMYDKWLPQLARDPAYNPNFSLSMPGGYMLADSQISWRPLDSIRPAPVALVHPADLFGCGHYRMILPFTAMKEAGLMDGAISTGLMHVTDLERYNPDTIILQRQIGDARLEAMRRMQRFSRAVKVYELDDYLPNLPLKSVHRKDMPKDIVKSLRRGLSFVDRFVVSTHAMAEAFAGMHGEIVVCENRLPTGWWDGLQTKRRQGKKPRVGWAGGSSHTGDLELIADVVRDLADEVEWVFFGMCPDALKPYVHEFHGGVAIEQYPAKLASLNLDLGLAPLEHNLFNECKSNLRQLEYGACGIPIICTDIRPYQDGLNAGLPVTLVKNRYKDWVEAIRMHINDLDATAKMADELQAKVKADWMLQGVHLERWRDAWLGK